MPLIASDGLPHQASRGEAWQCSDDDDDGDDDDYEDRGGGGGGCGGGGGGGGGGGSGGEDVYDGSGGGGDDDRMMADDGTTTTVKREEGTPPRAGTAGLSCKRETSAEMSAAEAVVKLEREAKAATALVAHTANIAKAFLEQTGVKISNRKRTYKQSSWRSESYEQGKVDSRDIDINQRSIH